MAQAATYAGRAQAFAGTDSGKEQAALRDIQKSWEDIGKAILPIERDLLPKVAKGIEAVAPVDAT